MKTNNNKNHKFASSNNIANANSYSNKNNNNYYNKNNSSYCNNYNNIKNNKYSTLKVVSNVGNEFRQRHVVDGDRKTSIVVVNKDNGINNDNIRCEKSIKTIFSRLDMLNLMKNETLPQDILLPKSIVNDCIEVNSLDLTFLINKIQTSSCFDKTDNTVKRLMTPNMELDWKLGSKITKLVHHDDSFVPRKLREQQQSMDKDDLLDFERNMKTVLNKMTPENFESCIGEMRKLNLKSELNLNNFVDQVFDKATREKSYSEMYSKLASQFSGLNANGKNFRCILLNQCQKLFKTPLETQIEEVKQFWNEKIKAEQNERMKVMYKESIEEKVNQVKDRYFGNMRFISELYLQNEIPDKIIVHIISILLNKEKDCTSLEAVCQILMVIGQIVEAKNPKEMDGFILKIDQLSQVQGLGMKMRFKLKDVIDMKNRNWQMRQTQIIQKVQPKTLKELQHDDDEISEPAKLFRNQNRL